MPLAVIKTAGGIYYYIRSIIFNILPFFSVLQFFNFLKISLSNIWSVRHSCDVPCKT